MRQLSIFLGALLAGLAVVFGAFGAHALKETLEPRMLAVFETGVRYQFIHALGLILVGALPERPGAESALKRATVLFLVGIVLFSGSLYGLSILEIRALGPVTPFGGVAFIVGWFSIAFAYRPGAPTP